MTGYIWKIPSLDSLDRETLPRIRVGSGVDCHVYNDMRLQVVFGTREVYSRLWQHFDTRYAEWEDDE